MIYFKEEIYKHFQRNNNNQQLEYLDNLTCRLANLVEEEKANYYDRLSRMLNDPKTSSKKYWSLLKTLMNGKKTPIIPPLLINNQFISDFKVKSNLFNNYFSDQCTPIANESQIPNEINHYTDKYLYNVRFSLDDICNIIRNLDTNKAHGYDNISVRIIKIFGNSICKPLEIIFRCCLEVGIFPAIWKKANIVPIHKKNERNLLKNYRPVSLLPVCSKIFERIIFNSLYNYLHINKLLHPNQSGFKPSDSCTNQLVSISHLIFSSFDHPNSHEVRGVFLDMSKAFDKVWHEGLLYKLKCFGISRNLFNILKSFLSNRLQRVTLNGQNSELRVIRAGVPQGSILGPLLFLIYVNDLPQNLRSTVKLFADDVSLFSVVKNDVSLSANDLNHDLAMISNWSLQWKMSFNPDPSKQANEVLFSRKRNANPHPNLFFNGTKVNRVVSQKHLGITLDEKLSFNEHVSINSL